jgi:phosphatidylinositol glycan class M
VFLLFFGLWQDHHLAVPYTDVDYRVFSDAAAHVVRGGSPYERDTYRYTPLLAWALTPTVLFSWWGKCIFIAADLWMGQLIQQYMTLRKAFPGTTRLCVNLWLFNPITVAISTRGSAEPLWGAFVLSALLCLAQRAHRQSAVWLALAIHCKIYPIIYVIPIMLLLASPAYGSTQAIEFGPIRISRDAVEYLGMLGLINGVPLALFYAW